MGLLRPGSSRRGTTTSATEDTGFPSVTMIVYSINTHEHVDQLKVQIGSAFKALLEMPTQFITIRSKRRQFCSTD